MTQDDIFMESEGDKYFKRNKELLGSFVATADNDYCMFLLKLYGMKPKKVLEVGACNGYRLEAIRKTYKSEVYASEPSTDAVEYGKEKHSIRGFQKATIKTTNFKEKFDLIIVNFAFAWVDRKTLLHSVAKVDELLKDGGYLIIGDFQTPYPIKREYHHRKGLFTYKLDYKKIFISTGLYKEIAVIGYNHLNSRSVKNLAKDGFPIQEFSSASLLKKEVNEK